VPAAAVQPIDGEAARRALTLAFDVYELEQERARLTYGEKALVAGLGLVGVRRRLRRAPGRRGHGGGHRRSGRRRGRRIALGVNRAAQLGLGKRAEEGRAQLKVMGAPANARATTVPVGAVAVAF
jgi:hypothetical protein